MTAKIRTTEGGVEESWYRSIVEALKGHPNALLAFALTVSAGVLLKLEVNQWLACGFPGSLYLAYCLRGWRSDISKERLADARVKEIEAQKGAPIRQRRRPPALPPPKAKR